MIYNTSEVPRWACYLCYLCRKLRQGGSDPIRSDEPTNLIVTISNNNKLIYTQLQLSNRLGCVHFLAGSRGAQNWRVDVGAIEPPLGDDAVRGLGHVDPVPAHMGRDIGAHGRGILVALGLQIEVVFPHSGSSTAGSQGSSFKSC